MNENVFEESEKAVLTIIQQAYRDKDIDLMRTMTLILFNALSDIHSNYLCFPKKDTKPEDFDNPFFTIIPVE